MSTPTPAHDLVVLGSGAAGLTAAVLAAAAGLRVAVYEKGHQIGGTSAWSGGHVWIPDNPLMPGVGVRDSAEDAVTYLLSMSRGLMDPDVVRAFVAAGPRMVEELERVADIGFSVSVGIPDYHPERPGARAEGGRTLETSLFPFTELGEWADRVTVSPYYANPHLAMRETPTGQAVPAVVDEGEMERRRDADERGMGQALIGRLLHACLKAGVDVRTDHRGVRLLRDAERVVGVVVDGPDGEFNALAARGVVLATGGFEWNEELCRAFLRGPMTHPISIETNTGDGLVMAMDAGAALANMREAFWTTVADVPTDVAPRGRMMLSGDRARPRAIMVNRHGERFANESANYNAFGGAFHAEDISTFEYRNLPCWLVFDHGYLTRYGTVRHPAGDVAPEWLTSAPTLRELAERLGIPPEALEVTVARWNAAVADGRDPDFGRGESAHDRWWGDPRFKGSIAASLGPLDRAPYFAIEVHPGAMGTKGGPRIDGNARVLGRDGRPIAGLYAAGNVMAAPYGMTYGGAGGTLGPAMVAGFLAASHAVGEG